MIVNKRKKSLPFPFKVNRLSILAVWTKGKVKHPSQITEIYILCHQVTLAHSMSKKCLLWCH